MLLPRATNCGSTTSEVSRPSPYFGVVLSPASSLWQCQWQACNVAFIKTHKTASTTLAMIFVRYAKRHNKKVQLYRAMCALV